MQKKGKLFGIGVGPGDPELITIKGLKALESSDVVAFHCAKYKKSRAFNSVEYWIKNHQKLLPLIYPVTKEISSIDPKYKFLISRFYKKIKVLLKKYLDSNKNVAVLSEGDPLLYSSFIYIYNMLGSSYETLIIPGVTSISGATSVIKTPLCYKNQTFTILSGFLSKDILEKKLLLGDAFAIIKISNNIKKIRSAIDRAGLLERSIYIENATMKNEYVKPLHELQNENCPYFSIIIIPGKSWNTLI